MEQGAKFLVKVTKAATESHIHLWELFPLPQWDLKKDVSPMLLIIFYGHWMTPCHLHSEQKLKIPTLCRVLPTRFTGSVRCPLRPFISVYEPTVEVLQICNMSFGMTAQFREHFPCSYLHYLCDRSLLQVPKDDSVPKETRSFNSTSEATLFWTLEE